MKNCSNHPDKAAYSICHGCGKDFCESCLVEGEIYYYCKKPECQELLKKELPSYKAPEYVICPKCNSDLELSKDERIVGKIHCPECTAIIDFTVVPPSILKGENYTEMLSSLNQGDIALIKSILEDADVDFFILGENFLGVQPLLEPARIFVNANQISKVKELFKDFDYKIFGISTKQY